MSTLNTHTHTHTHTSVQMILMTHSPPSPSAIFGLISRPQLNIKQWKEASAEEVEHILRVCVCVCVCVWHDYIHNWEQFLLCTPCKLCDVNLSTSEQGRHWDSARWCSPLLFPILQVIEYLHGPSWRLEFGFTPQHDDSALSVPGPDMGLLSGLNGSNKKDYTD